MDSSGVTISIIIPVYYSENVLSSVIQLIVASIGSRFSLKEIICVDDGSQDQSWAVIKQLSQKYPQVRGLRLSKNFGQWAATMCGLRNSMGDILLTLDDDGQCDPLDGIRIIERLIEENADVVVGVRNQVRTKILDFLSALIWNKAHTSNFIGMKREVIHSLGLTTATKMSLDAHLRWILNRHILKKIDISYQPRLQGCTQYTFLKRFWMVQKNIFNYFSFGELFVGGFFVWISGVFVLGGEKTLNYLVVGLQVVILGYLNSIFLEYKGKPYYWIIEQYPDRGKIEVQ